MLFLHVVNQTVKQTATKANNFRLLRIFTIKALLYLKAFRKHLSMLDISPAERQHSIDIDAPHFFISA